MDIKFIKKNKEAVLAAIKKKKVVLDLDRLLALDEQRRQLIAQSEEIRFQQKGLDQKEITRARELKEKYKQLETELKKAEADFNELALKVPNIISPDTPDGPDESGNQVLRTVGKPPKFDFPPKDHLTLGAALGLIDTNKAATISGARFNYLFGAAVWLQFAILHLVWETLTSEKIIKKLAGQVNNPFAKPFVPVLPPVMAKSAVMKKMDRFDPLEDRYFLPEDDILLVGSAEHTLGPLHMDEILNEADLPVRYIGYSTAFRREAGSYGKDTAGILRRHQFDKAEMESFIQPEYGLVEQDLIVALQEYLVGRLEIPYRVVAICSGDMGKPDFRQIDLECWLPGQNKYRETHTSDYMTDFQSRRLNIRYKDENGQKMFVHMNDATAFAFGRILIALLENFQQADGSIKIPRVLQPYFGGQKKILSQR
ncbi:MAG: serine--tRNA ligase [Candidatus Portnoybacteria bacterium CG10_big_fil_rev_8_21_14_0_10_44_7]|uniref:Serine--tRNA ligase n=1 Tax=Candidatus Portnoybacteria bacterium CG10_big_fil_rev_8_21_14_0_10_44_7 TaxID=1974816 RepID=A0A2M8KIE5_9BACT|nr:MAG: serine--tRNA ligase [Candidatus Portnoybacteria bacterium CG10_big_fil_rev_8_21_14_0_10_44_7]